MIMFEAWQPEKEADRDLALITQQIEAGRKIEQSLNNKINLINRRQKNPAFGKPLRQEDFPDPDQIKLEIDVLSLLPSKNKSDLTKLLKDYRDLYNSKVV